MDSMMEFQESRLATPVVFADNCGNAFSGDVIVVNGEVGIDSWVGIVIVIVISPSIRVSLRSWDR